MDLLFDRSLLKFLPMRFFHLFYLSMLFFLTSCDFSVPRNSNTLLEEEAKHLLHNIEEGNMRVVEIQNCEYVIFKDRLNSNQGFGYMSHKGNCKNPIHQYNQVATNNSKDTSQHIKIKHLD